jgi:hypothetical protein
MDGFGRRSEHSKGGSVLHLQLRAHDLYDLKSSKLRARIYHAFISMVLHDHPDHSSSGFNTSFSFLLDVSDGHMQSTSARSLGLPILVLSKNPQEDDYTMPFPDVYQVCDSFNDC